MRLLLLTLISFNTYALGRMTDKEFTALVAIVRQAVKYNCDTEAKDVAHGRTGAIVAAQTCIADAKNTKKEIKKIENRNKRIKKALEQIR